MDSDMRRLPSPSFHHSHLDFFVSFSKLRSISCTFNEWDQLADLIRLDGRLPSRIKALGVRIIESSSALAWKTELFSDLLASPLTSGLEFLRLTDKATMGNARLVCGGAIYPEARSDVFSSSNRGQASDSPFGIRLSSCFLVIATCTRYSRKSKRMASLRVPTLGI